jgi:hypothetical protein
MEPTLAIAAVMVGQFGIAPTNIKQQWLHSHTPIQVAVLGNGLLS